MGRPDHIESEVKGLQERNDTQTKELWIPCNGQEHSRFVYHENPTHLENRVRFNLRTIMILRTSDFLFLSQLGEAPNSPSLGKRQQSIIVDTIAFVSIHSSISQFFYRIPL